MKYLFVLLTVIGCKTEDKTKPCGMIPDAVIRGAAMSFSQFQECNAEKVLAIFIKAEEKVLSCDSGLNIAGINGSSLICSTIPQLVKSLGDLDLLQMECQKTGGDLALILKKVLKCE